MSDQRMEDVLAELYSWSAKYFGTKGELLSLLGKLVFMCRVIRPGRIFLRRLFSLSSKVKYLHHRVRLTKESRRDIMWWIEFASTWNRKSVFYEDRWVSSCHLDLATDASDLGFVGVFGRKWFMSSFTPAQTGLSIASRELYAVLVACVVWGPLLSSYLVLVTTRL